MKKIVLSLVVFTFSGDLLAVENSPKKPIIKLVSYADYGNEDVFVLLESTSPICNGGYYIDKLSGGYKNIVSMLISAYHAKTPIIVKANETKKWAGNPNVCRIDAIYYQ